MSKLALGVGWRCYVQTEAWFYLQFLLYYYLSPTMKETIDRNTIHGATVHIGSGPSNTMGEWPIAIPELAEQQAIAEVLGALDGKIAANGVAVRTARDIGRLLFQQEVGQANSRGARCYQ